MLWKISWLFWWNILKKNDFSEKKNKVKRKSQMDMFVTPLMPIRMTYSV